MKELGWGRHSTSAVGRGFELGLSQAGAQTLNPSCILSIPWAYTDSYAVRWWFLRTKSITKISSSTLDIKAISVYRVPPDQKLMYECVYVYICIHRIYFTCTYEIHILKTYLNNNKKIPVHRLSPVLTPSLWQSPIPCICELFFFFN